MPGLVRLEDHKFYSSDRVVIDTNVWLLVHGQSYGFDPIMQRRAAPCTATLSKLVARGTVVFALDVILIEFINVMEREAAQSWQRANSSLVNEPTGKIKVKRFRQETVNRSTAMAEIRRAIHEILKFAAFGKASLELEQIDPVLDTFQAHRADITDTLIARFCAQNDCALLTADHDLHSFADQVTVVTSQPGP